MSRSRHPNPAIEAAVKYAEGNGFTVVNRTGHPWGLAMCDDGPDGDRCLFWIWSTPKNPETHAKKLRRLVGRCPHPEPWRPA